MPTKNYRKPSYTFSIICGVIGIVTIINGLPNPDTDAVVNGATFLIIGGVLYLLKKSKTQR